jgi:hypothetical protein
MELGGLEPPTSWVRCKKPARKKWPICRGFRGARRWVLKRIAVDYRRFWGFQALGNPSA